MKSIRFRLLVAGLAVLLGTALAKSQTADAPPPPPMHGHGPMAEHMLDYFTRQLNLTDDQLTQAKALMQKQMSGMKPLFQQERQIEKQLHHLAESDTYDANAAAKVQTLATQKAQLDAQLTVARTQLHSQMYQLLTPDQRTQLKQIEATQQARWQKHMQNQEPPAPPEQ